MPEKKIYLIVGLGNPGITYEKTRHNIGFVVVDYLADSCEIPFLKQKFNAKWTRGQVGKEDVILIKPMSYMNNSGTVVYKFVDYFKLSINNIIVVHDDIDLDFGKIKIKEKGGHGGQNGVRSIIESLGDDKFFRLRIGIGRSETRTNVTDHVLSQFLKYENDVLDKIVDQASQAITTILKYGSKQGMNKFHGRNII